jgi:hypothetical protein
LDNKPVQTSKKDEKKVLAWQLGVFIAMFILFIPTSIITLYLFNGSIKFMFIPLSLPLLYIGISSIKNKISIAKIRGQKGPSRDKTAVTFGWLIIGIVIIQLLFVFTSDATGISNLLTRGFTSSSSYVYEFLPIYDETYTKQIHRIDENSQFAELNIFTDISAGSSYQEIPLALNENMVLIAGAIGTPEGRVNPDLINASISTGKINWQTLIGTSAIAIDTSNVYAQLPNQPFGGAAGVVAFDMESGSKLWETVFNWRYAIGIDYLAITNNLLSVGTYNHGDEAFYSLEPASGKVKTVVKNRNDLFMIDDGTNYGWISRQLTAEGKSNWQTLFSSNKYSAQSFELAAPVVFNNLILVKNGTWNLGSVSAVRKTDGLKVWQYDQIIASNITVGGTITYFVTDTAKLIALGTQTGEVLGSVNFSPAFADDFDFSNNSIYVAAYNNFVTVYFEDTQQLSIIKFMSL